MALEVQIQFWPPRLRGECVCLKVPRTSEYRRRKDAHWYCGGRTVCFLRFDAWPTRVPLYLPVWFSIEVSWQKSLHCGKNDKQRNFWFRWFPLSQFLFTNLCVSPPRAGPKFVAQASVLKAAPQNCRDDHLGGVVAAVVSCYSVNRNPSMSIA